MTTLQLQISLICLIISAFFWYFLSSSIWRIIFLRLKQAQQQKKHRGSFLMRVDLIPFTSLINQRMRKIKLEKRIAKNKIHL